MITDNLRRVKQDLDAYPNAQLIAVSKKQHDEKINAILKAGHRIFGENRLQEAQNRWPPRLKLYPDLELHFIGPIQRNKVKAITSFFDYIHTLDREKIAREIIKYKPDMPCFIQVNIGDEPQKAGIACEDLADFHEFCTKDLSMNISGLMCLPPQNEPPEHYFRKLATQAQTLNLKHLSMGMSHDYRLALRHGATHIRVGSGLFGERAV